MAKHDDDDVSGPITAEQEIQVFLTRPFLAVCGLLGLVCAAVLSLCGWIATDWMERVERELRTLKSSVGEFGTIPYRLAELEKREARTSEDIQELQRWRWQNDKRQ